MKLRTLAFAAIAATTLHAQAGLTTLPSWDAAFASNGLAGVQFNANTAGGATVALGAHAYKNGVAVPNNGTNTFYANSGIYAADSLGRANWSFDFVWSLGSNCADCTVHLMVDKDPTAGTDFVDLFATNAAFTPLVTAPGYMDSWNMEMAFIAPLVYDFNPFAPSSTGFELQIRDANGGLVVGTDITVNVPEPGTLALAGLGLAGLVMSRRKQKNK